jgi:hypothetical protein
MGSGVSDGLSRGHSGRVMGANPESITPVMPRLHHWHPFGTFGGYGVRPARFAPGRNDG